MLRRRKPHRDDPAVEPGMPVNVRLVTQSEDHIPIDLVYAGRNLQGVHIWYPAAQVYRDDIVGVVMDSLPQQTMVVMQVILPPP